MQTTFLFLFSDIMIPVNDDLQRSWFFFLQERQGLWEGKFKEKVTQNPPANCVKNSYLFLCFLFNLRNSLLWASVRYCYRGFTVAVLVSSYWSLLLSEVAKWITPWILHQYSMWMHLGVANLRWHHYYSFCNFELHYINIMIFWASVICCALPFYEAPERTAQQKRETQSELNFWDLNHWP